MSPKVLLYDVECAPVVAHIWGLRDLSVGINQVVADPYVLGVGHKWYGGAPARYLSVNKLGRQTMLERTWALFDEADVVVGYNHIGFDNKWMNGEFAREGLTPPSPYKNIDLLKIARANFRFPSYKLQYVSTALGLEGKLATGGHDLWIRTMVGDPAADRKMARYCLTPDHKVLGEDLRWRPIGECEVGDVILGFEEHKPSSGGRQYRRAVVKATTREMADLYKVTLSSGKTFRVTGNHQWLIAHMSPSNQVRKWEWKETLDLLVGGKSLRKGQVTNGRRSDAIPQLFNVWDEDTSKDAGWLAGMLDGEGHLSVRANKGQRSAGGFTVGVCQKVGPEADRLELLMKEKSGSSPLIYVSESGSNGLQKLPLKKIVLHGPMHEKLDFLGRIRPERLIPKVDFDHLGRVESRNRMDYVVNVERIPDGEVVVMETSTGTFIADGYPMHNCKQDVNLLEPLLDKMRPWIGNAVNFALWSEQGAELACQKCGEAEFLRPKGMAYTATRAYKQWWCKPAAGGCGGWTREARMDPDFPAAKGTGATR